ncbi:phosphatase PAP2 family protein [Devosia neptuniae]|jgi:undecaprenyl-diphosphatase|uniref:phosphatase PAP2 family protein n=1 Tax=Devosia TaxID=46913 RepID=UPI0022AF2C59|nr:phosphatase PAP2 family protein [Devosia neptuniae]MCZ4344432.1 phosphatase PAP2 family protein [Devosia neptuniae]|tara:strand:+ start:4288 stop:5019 length:732 start_codon:yes stop_codon:yes gene_type:complete
MLDRLVQSPAYRRLHGFVAGEARLLASIAIVSGLILAFLQIADEMIEGEMEAFDQAILMLFRDPANLETTIGPVWLHEMVRDITALGSFSLLGLIVVGVCIYLLLARMRAEALLVVTSVVGGTILSTLLKMGYNRPRPDLTTMSEQFTASFPSGHAMLSAVTFLTLGAVLSRFAPTRPLRFFTIGMAVLLTLMVGLSRLYMGVHYPSDVLAGWCLGAAWALICSTVAMYLQRTGTVRKDALPE